ncbi:MAG: hypothetical protein ACXV3C_07655 [Actinomycetes bacterium]
MIVAVTTVTAVALTAAALALLARELRGGGYGRASIPSISEVGAERSRVLTVLARSRGDGTGPRRTSVDGGGRSAVTAR